MRRKGRAACQQAACHAKLDLHAIHRSNNHAGDNSCTNSLCHDSTKQAERPTKKSCGLGGDCHNTATPHTAEAAKHTVLNSINCVVCHESNDLKLTHGDACGTCHNNPSYPNVPRAGQLECTSCHNGVDVGAHVYDPYNPNHYMSTNHTSVDTTAGATGIVGTADRACSMCHYMDLKPEHVRSTVATDWAGDVCVGCHETKVDAIKLAGGWAQVPSAQQGSKCLACHDLNDIHPSQATSITVHDFSTNAGAVENAECALSGCHDGSLAFLPAITDVMQVHAASGPGNGECTSCHGLNKVPTETRCVDCHNATTPFHDVEGSHSATQTVQGAQCVDTCHEGMADISALHGSGACTNCHGNPALQQYVSDNYTADCTTCHKASGIYDKAYAPYDTTHYSETTHAAAPWTYADQSEGANGTVLSESKECGNCHTASMKLAHSNTSTDTALTADGQVDCKECHAGTSLDSLQIITNNWPARACVDCHDYDTNKTHDGYTTIHQVSTTRGCARFGRRLSRRHGGPGQDPQPVGEGERAEVLHVRQPRLPRYRHMDVRAAPSTSRTRVRESAGSDRLTDAGHLRPGFDRLPPEQVVGQPRRQARPEAHRE